MTSKKNPEAEDAVGLGEALSDYFTHASRVLLGMESSRHECSNDRCPATGGLPRAHVKIGVDVRLDVEGWQEALDVLCPLLQFARQRILHFRYCIQWTIQGPWKGTVVRVTLLYPEGIPRATLQAYFWEQRLHPVYGGLAKFFADVTSSGYFERGRILSGEELDGLSTPFTEGEAREILGPSRRSMN